MYFTGEYIYLCIYVCVCVWTQHAAAMTTVSYCVAQTKIKCNLKAMCHFVANCGTFESFEDGGDEEFDPVTGLRWTPSKSIRERFSTQVGNTFQCTPVDVCEKRRVTEREAFSLQADPTHTWQLHCCHFQPECLLIHHHTSSSLVLTNREWVKRVFSVRFWENDGCIKSRFDAIKTKMKSHLTGGFLLLRALTLMPYTLCVQWSATPPKLVHLQYLYVHTRRNSGL